MKKNQKSFTLLELLIVIAIIVTLAITVIVVLNPFKQIGKGWDAKRRQELSGLQKAFDDYYNDKNFYPKDSDVCFDEASQENDICSCHICGTEEATPSFTPYLNTLPCDPQHGKTDYLYQYNCNTNQWFKIYALLDENNQSGGYDYGVGSGNISLEPYPTSGIQPTVTSSPQLSTPTPTTSINNCPNYPLWCTQTIGQAPQPQQLTCKFCGYLADCQTGECDKPLQLFTNSYCSDTCQP